MTRSGKLNRTRIHDSDESGFESDNTYDQNRESKSLKKVNMTVEELLMMSVGDLNKRLRSMPAAESRRIKQLRRTLKNRGYAAICRGKRVEQVSRLENEKRLLIKQIQQVKEETSMYLREHKQLTEKYHALKKLADQKVHLRTTMQVIPDSATL